MKFREMVVSINYKEDLRTTIPFFTDALQTKDYKVIDFCELFRQCDPGTVLDLVLSMIQKYGVPDDLDIILSSLAEGREAVNKNIAERLINDF